MELLVYNDHCGFYRGKVCTQLNSVCGALVSLNSNVGAIYCVRYDIYFRELLYAV